MMSPVRCAYCSRVYDLGTVEVTARYMDCSVWVTPCCGRTVDDRGETGWKTTKDYYPITDPQPCGEFSRHGLYYDREGAVWS